LWIHNQYIPSDATVKIWYRQFTGPAYFEAKFEKNPGDNTADIVIDCPVPWQPFRPNYYKVFRINQNGSEKMIKDPDRDDDLWTALSSDPFTVRTPIQAAFAQSGQNFRIELWLNNVKRYETVLRAASGETVWVTDFCGIFPNAGSCKGIGFDYESGGEFCRRAAARMQKDGKWINKPPPQGLDHNICHMPVCKVAETTPGGVCDPEGDGLDYQHDLTENSLVNIWEPGYFSFGYWAKEKCGIEY
jgi:hypothetical protein